MKRNVPSTMVAVFLLIALWATPALCDLIGFVDDFTTDTTGSYTWTEEGVGGDGDPANNVAYDAAHEWVSITTANNNNIRMRGALSEPITSGHFAIDFMPWQTYPTDGAVQLRLYGVNGDTYAYHWDFARDSGLPSPGAEDVYRAHLEKWVDGVPVIEEIFVPTPDHYDLDAWHTLALDFSPLTFTGYLDGQSILTRNDLAATPIWIDAFEIVFRQQDQHLDNIRLTDLAVVPLPASALLAAIGLATATWRCRRQTR